MLESLAWAADNAGGIGRVMSSLIEWIIIFTIIYYVIKWWRRKAAKEEKQINETTFRTDKSAKPLSKVPPKEWPVPPEKWPELCPKIAANVKSYFDIWFTKCIETLRNHGIQPVNSDIYTPEGLSAQAKVFGFQILFIFQFVKEKTYVREESDSDFLSRLCDELSKINSTWKEGVNYFDGNLSLLYAKEYATSKSDDFLVDDFFPKAVQEPARSIAHYLTLDETKSDAIELIEHMMPALVLFTQIAVAVSFGDYHTVPELMAKVQG